MDAVHDRIFGEIPAKHIVCSPYIYGSGQPYACAFGEAGENPIIYS